MAGPIKVSLLMDTKNFDQGINSAESKTGKLSGVMSKIAGLPRFWVLLSLALVQSQ